MCNATRRNKAAADLAQEEVRLRATDPEKERGRIAQFAAKVEIVAAHVGTLAAALHRSKISEAESAHSKAVELRAAAACGIVYHVRGRACNWRRHGDLADSLGGSEEVLRG